MARRRWGSVGLTLVAALTLSACWPVPGQNADRTAHNPLETTLTPATVGNLTELWSATAGDGAVGSPVVSGGGVFVTSGAGVHRHQASTGAQQWTWTPPEPSPISQVGNPFVVDGRILVGYGIPNLGGRWASTWLDPATGAELEPAPLDGLVEGVRGSTAVAQSRSFGSGTPVVTRFVVKDLDTGVTITGGAIDFQDSSSEGFSRFTLGSASAYHSGFGTIPPAEPGGATTRGPAVRAFPLESVACEPPSPSPCATWTTPVGGTPTAAVIGPGEDVFYVGTTEGTVKALEAATGAVLWTVDVGASVPHPPALASGVLYAPTTDGDIVALAADGCGAATCDPLWTAPTGNSSISAQPAVAGSGDDAVVYVGTATGDVLAFAASGCGAAVCDTPLWSTSTGSTITGGPSVTGGRVYVGTQDGRLIAFGLPPA